jgi:hypothetical protein
MLSFVASRRSKNLVACTSGKFSESKQPTSAVRKFKLIYPVLAAREYPTQVTLAVEVSFRAEVCDIIQSVNGPVVLASASVVRLLISVVTTSSAIKDERRRQPREEICLPRIMVDSGVPISFTFEYHRTSSNFYHSVTSRQNIQRRKPPVKLLKITRSLIEGHG